MADDIDFNDVLDNIALSEDTVRKESYEEGLRAGTEAGNPEGYHLGYHRGAELGRELGYYWGIVKHYLDNINTIEGKSTEKIVMQLEKVKELIDTFPQTNSEKDDILGIAENIRAHYKKACALLKIPSTNPFNATVSF